jgi:crotonobetainyl-CoA:carnitine CoA-transferase CaiB-like acyl-CoA transferase
LTPRFNGKIFAVVKIVSPKLVAIKRYTKMVKLPLEGFKIIDLTAAVAGPYCTQLLGDFGATIIKIEPPGKGDMLREVGPFIEEESYYFIQNNRNKRSMTLNLRSEKGVEILKRLAKNADILVENFRPNVKKKLGIDYEEMKKENPGLIYTSISGFGQTGPYANRPGFDPIAQGLSGICSVTGTKETGPFRVGVAIGDALGGIFVALGTLAAVIERQRSGEGQKVESSLLEGLVSVLGPQAAKYFATGERPEPFGNDHPMLSPFGTFKTKNGYMNIGAGYQKIWERLAKILQLEELVDDPRFLTVKDRVSHNKELTEIIEEKLIQKTKEDWEKELTDGGVPNGLILHIDEVFQNDQVLHQQMLIEKEHSLLGKLKMIGFPVKLSRTPPTVAYTPPGLGEHTDEILVEHGYSQELIAEYREQNVL